MFTDKQRNNSENGKERRLANLKPFQPGQSGNPSGRPKQKTLSEALRQLLGESVGKTGKTNAEAIAKAIVTAAKKGDVKAFAAIADRTEGKPRQAVDITNQTEVEKERAKFEAAVQGIMEDTGCDYQDALKALITVNPEHERFLQ